MDSYFKSFGTVFMSQDVKKHIKIASSVKMIADSLYYKYIINRLRKIVIKVKKTKTNSTSVYSLCINFNFSKGFIFCIVVQNKLFGSVHL